VTKLATAVIYLLVGVGLGYILWGARVDTLIESLNRMVLEEDSLQSRLVNGSASDTPNALTAALGDLAEQLRDQSTRIAEQAEAIELITGDKSTALKDQLTVCSDRAGRLERDLERCLFEKAGLQHDNDEAAPVVPTPTSGTSPVEKTVSYPGMDAARKAGEAQAAAARASEGAAADEAPKAGGAE